MMGELEKGFPVFLQDNLKKNPLKCEFFLPFAVEELMEEGKAKVKVLKSEDRWYGGVGQTTHGQHNRARKPGSIGACSYPAKVFKGMRMGGQLGGDRVTVQNLQVLKVIAEHNLLLIKGSIPGCKGSIVLIEK